MAKIEVKHPEPAIKTEILAESIVRIGEAMESLEKSGLNERAILALVYDGLKGNVSKKDIQAVFDAQRQLRAWYCR